MRKERPERVFAGEEHRYEENTQKEGGSVGGYKGVVVGRGGEGGRQTRNTLASRLRWWKVKTGTSG